MAPQTLGFSEASRARNAVSRNGLLSLFSAPLSRHRRPSPPRARPTPALLLLFVPVRSLRRHACVSSAVIRDGQPVTRPCRRSAPRRSARKSRSASPVSSSVLMMTCSANPPWILPVVRSQLACSTRVALVAVRWLVELASARTGLVQYARLKTLPQSSAAAWTPAPSAGCRTEGSGSTTAAKESSRPQVGIRHHLHRRATAPPSASARARARWCHLPR
jgi:hypothetical protein